jgi:hypothetical protein
MTPPGGSDFAPHAGHPRAVLDDGSLAAHDGRILAFSAARFRSHVVAGLCCFVCGREPSAEVPFNDEHVIPDWILRAYNLQQLSIGLPNDSAFGYANYKIPCCVDCNSWLGENVERPVREILSCDLREVEQRLNSNSRALLFLWCALLFTKTHLKDATLRMHLDRRKGDQRIGDQHDWDALHHVHAVARANRMGIAIDSAVFGSLQLLRSCPPPPRFTFDYRDHTPTQSMMVRLGQLCVFAVLDDSGAAQGILANIIERVRGRALGWIQQREVLAHLGYANSLLTVRPHYSTRQYPNGQLAICADLPPRIEARDFVAGEFGQVLLQNTKDILQVTPPGGATEGDVERGEKTFLFDDSGNFLNTSPGSER